MLARRIATFVLGAWIGCGLLMAVLVLQNPRSVDLVMAAVRNGPARDLTEQFGPDAVQSLLTFQTSEQNRAYLSHWEEAQVVLGLALLVALVMFNHKRVLLLVLCGAMLGLTLFQHVRLSPEMASQGREADFMSSDTAYAIQSRVRTLNEFYGAAEVVKLLMGGVLVSILFIESSSSRGRGGRRRRSSRSEGEVPEEVEG